MTPSTKDPRLLQDLIELLRIPSVSTDGGDEKALRQAAEWLVERVHRSGGEASLFETSRNPIVVGDLKSKDESAPSVIIYGHYDVQAIGDPSLWTTAPFEPEIRGDRIYARGASDDKGNFLPLLHAACDLFESGELPVNVRIFIEGEEERGSASAIEWVEQDERGADCCIIYDSGSFSTDAPAITIGTRGVVQVRVRVQAAERDMHSGLYGGSVYNSLHVLIGMLKEVLPGPDGVLRDELRSGITPITEAERASWNDLPPGDLVIQAGGGRALSEDSGAVYYDRNWGDASLDVNKIAGGEARTVIPAEASAFLTERVAPGQDAQEIGAAIERILRDAAPDSADVEIEWEGVDASFFDPDEPALKIARQAVEKATGKNPILMRLGGTLPIMAPLSRRGIPTILTGFATAIDSFHGPDESYRIEALDLGADTARELLIELAALR